MKIAEHCLEAEIRIREIQSQLAEPSVERLERCEAEIRLLIRGLPSPQAGLSVEAQDRAALQRLRQSVRAVAVQLQHGVRLCQGWAQLFNSSGYTQRGVPILVRAESTTSFEA